MREYVNLEKNIRAAYNLDDSRRQLDIRRMLEETGLKSERHDSRPNARDEAFDLAMIAAQLAKNKHEFRHLDKIVEIK